MSTLLIRNISPFLEQDLKEKMVFLGGPRQVGKTTLAQSLLSSGDLSEKNNAYLNWDNPVDKKLILNGKLPLNHPLLILDEIHKYKNWRNLVKGLYDTYKSSQQFLITGSARLDYYRKGGDSLLGRYHYYRLHPLSWSEVKLQKKKYTVEHLLKFGGFPEPFLKGTDKDLRRWHAQRNSRIVYTDIRDLENIREISLIELLISVLPERVGSILSKKNLAQDLDLDFKTVEKWITILENVYYCFRISPFGSPKIRAVKKEQKLFLWDWSELEDPGARWENFMASHLLKYCHFLTDTEGFKMELRFLRDHDKREVDFVVMQNKKPLFAVECKYGEKQVSPSVKYFSERTAIPRFYQVHAGTSEYQHSEKIHVMPFERFCSTVGLV
jgi:predicted AAA+ superfamily ATPase